MIDQRVALQRRMFQAFEAQERTRKAPPLCPRPPARPGLTTSAKPGSDTWRLETAAGSHRLCLSFRKQSGSLSDRQTVAPACL